MAVPRDLVVTARGDEPTRAAMTLRPGPETTVDAISRSLGIGIDHFILIGMDGLRCLVNAVGGIAINVDAPVRDVVTGLSITRPGWNHLDGEQALAYVRSRHVERFDEGQWRPGSTGAEDRSNHAIDVLVQLGSRLRSRAWLPLASARRLWVLAGAVTLDEGAGPFALLALARAAAHLDDVQVVVLPVSFRDGEVPVAILGRDAHNAIATFNDGAPSASPLQRR